jgi:tetratricopeptide (TPR) repeat protein
VALYREDPEPAGTDLARALNNLANRLAEAGRPEEALAAAVEAVELYREAARRQPGLPVADFATALDNVAVCMGRLGRYEDARAARGESAEIWRSLSEAQPQRHQDDRQASDRIGAWLDDLPFPP